MSSSEKDDPAAQIAPQNKTQVSQGILEERWWELLVCRIAECLLAALPGGRVTVLEELNFMHKLDVLAVLGVPWGGR